jgi:hypothetical protein
MSKEEYVKPTMAKEQLKVADTPAMTSASQMNTEVRTVSQATVEESERIEAAEHSSASEVGDFDPHEAIREDTAREAALKYAAEQTAKTVFTQKKEKVSVNAISSHEIDDILSASIIARPLQMPNFLDLRAKDPNYRLRWVNCKAQGGVKYDAALGMGFRVAKKEEVIGLNSTIMLAADGIKYHDVILMIIETAKLLGHYKYNFMRSISRVQKSGQEALNMARIETQKGLNAEHVPTSAYMTEDGGHKLEYYIPAEKEILSR